MFCCCYPAGEPAAYEAIYLKDRKTVITVPVLLMIVGGSHLPSDGHTFVTYFSIHIARFASILVAA